MVSFWTPERHPKGPWNGTWMAPGIGPDLFSIVSVLISVLVKMGGSDTNCYSFWSPLSPTIEIEHIYIYICMYVCMYVYINPENMTWSPDKEWTNLNPFFAFRFEQGMDLLRLWRAPPFLWIFSDNGSGREQVFLFQNVVIIQGTDTNTWIYTLLP